MTILSRISVAVATMLVIAIVCSAGAIWTARKAIYHIERSELAHAQYRAYLSLSAHSFDLFKAFGDAALTSGADVRARQAQLEQLIRSDIAELRRLTAREVALVGGEELEEFDFLERVETRVEYLLEEHAAGLDTLGAVPPDRRWDHFAAVMGQGLGRAFDDLIRLGLDEEAEEVAAAREETLAVIRRYQVLAVLLGLAALVAGGVSILSLIRGVQRPVADIVAGATAFAAGDYSRRLGEHGAPECSELASALNRLVEEVMRREEALGTANRQLEGRISERTAELEAALDTLRRSERQRRMMLADVSHELRTPLTIIRGEADVTLRGDEKTPDEYCESLARVRDIAEHTSRIVEDLLFIARQEAGELRLRREPLDVVELVTRCVEANQPRAVAVGKTITLTVPTVPVEVDADAMRLRQVVDIFLDNALRYGDRQVSVTIVPRDGHATIAVADDGPGLGAEERSSVFERFYRGAGGREGHADGVGLGLPVAKSIVEAHDASIAIESERGEGTRFSFALPLIASVDTAA